MFNIAIDGFTGCGKSTLVKRLAKEYKGRFKVLETGDIFRTFALAWENSGLEELNDDNINILLNIADISVDFDGDKQQMFINGQLIEDDLLETESIWVLASKLSMFKQVRFKYLEIAKTIAKKYDCIMQGKDIGTAIMPKADIKIFLTADQNSRAERRYHDLLATGQKVEFDEVLKELQECDERDLNREMGALKMSDDYVVVDNSDMVIEETLAYCVDIINDKLNEIEFINITMDGYVCSGKSTIAKELARRLGFSVFDTGAVYRGIACAFDYMKYDENLISEKYIQEFARQINVSIKFIDKKQHVYVNGINYTNGLRTERISALSAKISPFTCIREKTLELQRSYAKTHNIVMEGRDIGSHVLPQADFKFFCTADENVRAKRRYEQQRAMGNDVEFEDILRELQERDYKDVNREHGALRILPDSIVIDTTNQSLEESVEFCLKHIKFKYPNLKIIQ